MISNAVLQICHQCKELLLVLSTTVALYQSKLSLLNINRISICLAIDMNTQMVCKLIFMKMASCLRLNISGT